MYHVWLTIFVCVYQSLHHVWLTVLHVHQSVCHVCWTTLHMFQLASHVWLSILCVNQSICHECLTILCVNQSMYNVWIELSVCVSINVSCMIGLFEWINQCVMHDCTSYIWSEHTKKIWQNICFIQDIYSFLLWKQYSCNYVVGIIYTLLSSFESFSSE